MLRPLHAVLLAALVTFATAQGAPAPISRSVVRIEATSSEPNYKIPWSPGHVSGGVGAGLVIAGNHILTNAHVVSNARFLTVSREGDAAPRMARVVHIAHDCDLALLTVDDPAFFKTAPPLAIGGIPPIESSVSVYGYPIGGDRLSVTRGIVSRIDFQAYSHSGIDSHLTIQIDAAINPGNSGGPVMQNGKVVGVAFQGYSGDVAQNVGYMIPTPVIKRFLADVADGHYDRYMDLSITTVPLANPAARSALKLKDDGTGIFVSDVYSEGSSDGYIRRGDVLLSIDGHPISAEGTVEIDGEIIPMAEIVERKLKGDQVVIGLLRDGGPLQVTIPLKEPWPYSLQANAYDVRPRYVVFGGLVFQPVDQDFISAYNPDNLRLRYQFDHFISDHIYRDRKELVALSGVLPDAVNSYAQDSLFSLIDRINGKKIGSLEDVSAAFAEASDYYVIELVGEGRPIVLEKTKVDEARQRIMKRYKLTSEQNLKS